MSAIVFAMPLSPEALARIANRGGGKGPPATPGTGAPADDAGSRVVVLPPIRIEASSAAAAPTLAEQAAAIAELHGIIRDTVLPMMPLVELGDASAFLDRLLAAVATLRRLAGEGAP